ncbi:alpha/beta fold hydrolase [Granulicella sibirica]|uniref:2-succinyl-6-hydroxy-2, 4-cyclohexadiene-1-carboxylate synthase n=1 Tax=Granulicella sibirica TaxID=2479048 RepID=A0A4Q0TAM6_9BACT|nr:alpha/beta hydrolase [Granulicella sibirica]RXH58701.1 2-succinyl-6-hydroxy-2,4-cyclohexadiene-1-carboxylate synthase [Granulicella sibirica]
MLPVRTSGAGSPALVMMHFLGGSAREWDEVSAILCTRFQCIAVDLPGFGAAAGIPGYSVEHMADAVADVLGHLRLERYILIGHSMSGKVAAVLARRLADHALHADHQLKGLDALVLVAPSPPSPEPIAGEKRAAMIENLGEVRGDHADEYRRAQTYVTKNETRDIPPEVLARATEEVLRMNRAAWVAWLEHGSREDWSERIGVLDIRTLIIAGEKDTSLGVEIQQRQVVPHFSNARLITVPGSGHLIPMEKPEELAATIKEFSESL